MRYSYEAVTEKGQRQIGYIESKSQHAALAELINYRLYGVKVRAEGGGVLIKYFGRFLEFGILATALVLVVKVALAIII